VFSPNARNLWEQVPLVSMMHSPSPLLQRGQENHVNHRVLGTQSAVLSHKQSYGDNRLWLSLSALSCSAGVFRTAQGTDEIVLHSSRGSFLQCVVEGKLCEDMSGGHLGYIILRTQPRSVPPHVRGWPVSVHLSPVVASPAGACWALASSNTEQQLCCSVSGTPPTMFWPHGTIEMSPLQTQGWERVETHSTLMTNILQSGTLSPF